MAGGSRGGKKPHAKAVVGKDAAEKGTPGGQVAAEQPTSRAGPAPPGGAAAGELVRGFRLLRLPVAAGSLVSRGLLVKRHEARDPAEKDSAHRTLFVTHVDNFVTEPQLLRCFTNAFGPVEKVELKCVEKKAPKAELRADNAKVHVNFARVVFKDAASVEKALEASTGRLAPGAALPLPGSELKEQIRAGKALYRDPGELRREVDEWMLRYDEKEEEKRRIARETQVDEDGFTKVISGITRTQDGVVMRSAKRPSLKTGAFAEPLRGEQDPSSLLGEGKKKKKEKEHLDFYRFQQRERRRRELMDHRKRKVVDREKVEEMRKAKKFKSKIR